VSDTQFIDYMRAFEASSKHLADCEPCQNDQPCEAGLPLHTDFATKQDAWKGQQ